ncbi:MAG: hypothetical protein LBN71_03960 [Tannerella sp.]|nr:hypothetical protein [Tannerella sp.]
MIIWSSLWGCIFAIGGFFISLLFDIPASSAIAALSSIVFIVILVMK